MNENENVKKTDSNFLAEQRGLFIDNDNKLTINGVVVLVALVVSVVCYFFRSLNSN